MLKNKLRMFLISLGLIFVITISMFGGIGHKGNSKAYASSNTYSVTQRANDLKDVKNVIAGIKSEDINSGIKAGSRGKILIYSSHSCEKYKDGSIELVGNDLAKKLTAKGFSVEHRTDDFANQQGYNRSYYSSDNMLKTKNLNDYVLIIDLHADSSSRPFSTQVNGKEVAQLMFPNVSENPNLKAETTLVNNIKSKLDLFGDKIFRPETTHYRRGINLYNLGDNPNMMLMEVGCDKNDVVSCYRSNTYFSSAVAQAIK